MLVKDKDILVKHKTNDKIEVETSDAQTVANKKIKLKHFIIMFAKSINYFLAGITSKYLQFSSRATRLELWGYAFIFSLSFMGLYYLSLYIEMELLAYAYLAALFVPSISLIVRRLHDINKNVILFLGSGFLAIFSAIFINFFAIIPILAWAILMIKELSRPSVAETNIYGEYINDEIYEEYTPNDSFKIIKLFRLIYLVIICLTITTSITRLDMWTQKAQQKDIIETILNNVFIEGKEQHLSSNQILEAQNAMRETLKTLQGQEVSNQDIENYILKAVAYGKQQDL